MVPAKLVTVTLKVFSPATKPEDPVTWIEDAGSAGLAATVTASVPGSRNTRPPFLTA